MVQKLMTYGHRRNMQLGLLSDVYEQHMVIVLTENNEISEEAINVYRELMTLKCLIRDNHCSATSERQEDTA